MNASEQNKIIGIGFGVFAGIFGFTFLLLLIISLGVFVSLGVSLANETGDSNQAGVGILGGIVAVVFYGVLGAVFVVPTAVACRKMLKRRRNSRAWGIVAAILVMPVMPLGTALGIFGLRFLFSEDGKRFLIRGEDS